MPLHDHFHLPGSRLPWETLHGGWLSELAGRINEYLPDGYIALDRMRIDGGLQVDVGVEEGYEDPPVDSDETNGTNGGVGAVVATARSVYTPPDATGTAEYQFPDVVELRVLSDRSEGRLVGAVELVSPGNKDRGTKRDAFVAKCIDYIAGGACVVVVDVITERRSNLHNEIVARIGGSAALELPEDVFLYAATYRPVIRKKKSQIDVWVNPLTVGGVLPTMPLRLVGNLFVPVELEWAYTEACRRRKFLV
jgi:hypothetical protein